MKLQILPQTFAVCKAPALPDALSLSPPLFLALTDEEVSILCPSDRVPEEAKDVEYGYRCFRIAGVLDFSLVGVLHALLTVLAEAKIPVLAVSSYNTDYLFIKEESFARALKLLQDAGHTLEYLD